MGLTELADTLLTDNWLSDQCYNKVLVCSATPAALWFVLVAESTALSCAGDDHLAMPPFSRVVSSLLGGQFDIGVHTALQKTLRQQPLRHATLSGSKQKQTVFGYAHVEAPRQALLEKTWAGSCMEVGAHWQRPSELAWGDPQAWQPGTGTLLSATVLARSLAVAWHLQEGEVAESTRLVDIWCCGEGTGLNSAPVDVSQGLQDSLGMLHQGEQGRPLGEVSHWHAKVGNLSGVPRGVGAGRSLQPYKCDGDDIGGYRRQQKTGGNLQWTVSARWEGLSWEGAGNLGRYRRHAGKHLLGNAFVSWQADHECGFTMARSALDCLERCMQAAQYLAIAGYRSVARTQ
ncbi:MAG: hypothetical protein FRX49_00248 [Trebouxia sp. A1-2]|nr:MAG: hypothetical protein FRX49_00248 [Trebouxia sp. A1-2]